MPELQFKGKTAVQYHHLAVPFHQLIPEKAKSQTNTVSLHDNLIVQGDNLLALKALLPTYAGKVKCIYIDPPYNTGNEGWKYNDKVNSPLIKDWIGQTVGKEGEDLTRHDKWLCMVLPRLKLLRELLSDNGAIVINIENNEYANLKLLADDIFGLKNFVGTYVWRKKEGGGQTKEAFVTEHEYILIYQKSDAFKWKDEVIQADDSKYKYEDKNGKYKLVKLAKWGNTARKEDRPKMHFPIYSPNGEKVLPVAPDGNLGRWRVGKARMDSLLEDNQVVFKSSDNGKTIAYEKVYYNEDDIETVKERSIVYDLTNTADASKQLTEIFGVKDKFDTPKPVDLVKYFLTYTTDKDSIVLDSFAGSGTTAQAVLELNKEDGGNRKFILVEMEEYANNITAERVRRVMDGVKTSKNPLVREGLGGTFSYFALGEAMELKSLLGGQKLPSWLDMARYVFYTATGNEFDPGSVDEAKSFAGKTDNSAVYVYYQPDLKWLKNYKFTLDVATQLRADSGTSKHIIVYAPSKYVDNRSLDELNMSFCQLPYEIYELKHS
jgi:adenine-specific DNA-methyltransferase